MAWRQPAAMFLPDDDDHNEDVQKDEYEADCVIVEMMMVMVFI